MEKLLIFLLFTTMNAQAYEVNIYDSSEPEKSVIEVIDDCQLSHKLIVKTNNIKSPYVVEWIDKLFDGNYFCEKNIDNKK